MSATTFYFIDDWDGAFTVAGRSLHTLGYHQTGDYVAYRQQLTTSWADYLHGTEPAYFYSYEFMNAVTIVGAVTSTIVEDTNNPNGDMRFTVGKRTAAGVETDIATSNTSGAITWPSTSFAQGDRIYIYFELYTSRVVTPPQDNLMELRLNVSHLHLPVAATMGNIVKPAAFYYHTLTNVAKDATMLWHVAAPLYKDAVIDYHTLAAVAQSGIMEWNTESNLTEVSVDAEFLYDTLALIYKDGAFHYNTMINVMQSMLHLALYLSAYTDMEPTLSQHTDLILEEVA